jgi:hypothetical protein
MPRLNDATRMVFAQKISDALDRAGFTAGGLRIPIGEIRRYGTFHSPMLAKLNELLKIKLDRSPPGTRFIRLTKREAMSAIEPTLTAMSNKSASALHRRIREAAVTRGPRTRQQPIVDIAGILGLAGAQVDVNEGAQAFGQDGEYGAQAFGQDVEYAATAFGQDVEYGSEAFGQAGAELEPYVQF